MVFKLLTTFLSYRTVRLSSQYKYPGCHKFYQKSTVELGVYQHLALALTKYFTNIMYKDITHNMINDSHQVPDNEVISVWLLLAFDVFYVSCYQRARSLNLIFIWYKIVVIPDLYMHSICKQG